MQLTRLAPFFNRLKRQLLSRVVLARILLLIFAVTIVVGLIWFLRRPGSAKFVADLATSTLPQHSSRTNFLILGIPGGDYEGADLTDSIVFLSVSHTGQPTVFLSIPRDLWVPSLRAKINTAYHYGRERANHPGGLLLAKSSVSEVINQPVDFVAVFDFATFSQVIDALGGLDVTVDVAFTDNRYPIVGRQQDTCGGDPEYNCRYETITFAAGRQHMDGSATLKFVRSRHSSDLAEGTDFARSRRQAKVLESLKAKLLSSAVLRRPSLYHQTLDLVVKNTVTDVESSHYAAIAKLAIKARNAPLTTVSLSEPDQFYHPPVSKKYDNQWVLVPKGDNPQVIFSYVSSLLK